MTLDEPRAHVGDRVVYHPPGPGGEAREGVISEVCDSVHGPYVRVLFVGRDYKMACLASHLTISPWNVAKGGPR